MQASHQWATRPSDERFTSLLDMGRMMQELRNNSATRILPNRALEAVTIDGDARGLAISGPNGVPVLPTHYAFGQLAQRAGAPAGYLRDIPAPLAADCINYGLRHAQDVQDLGVLLTKREGAPAVLRAVTGPNYGRIWNSTIVAALVDRFGDGVTGHFRVPGEFGQRVQITQANTTLYASDRDMFVFLADEDRRIEVPNRRNGASGSMARGFFVWNSEVGSATLGISTFLFDYVCCNRIVWGADKVSTIKIRHTSGAPHRWIEEVAPALEAYSESSATSVVQAIAAAKEARIENVDTFLRSRKFTGREMEGIKAAHWTDEQRPIETLWDAVTGVTAYARGIQYQDDRVELERRGGAILDMVAA
jgi:hypothetical protein